MKKIYKCLPTELTALFISVISDNKKRKNKNNNIEGKSNKNKKIENKDAQTDAISEYIDTQVIKDCVLKKT